MSSQIVSVVRKSVDSEDLKILSLSVVKNPLLKRHFSVPSIRSTRQLHPYTISSEDTGESMAQNLFVSVIRAFWRSRGVFSK